MDSLPSKCKRLDTIADSVPSNAEPSPPALVWYPFRRLYAMIVACMTLIAVLSLTRSTLADIYGIESFNASGFPTGPSDIVVPGTAGITAGPGIDLSGWNTAGHQLVTAYLGSFDLTNASFAGSNLFEADLTSSTLTSANFSNAYLVFTYFDSSNLTNASFANANLLGASLTSSTGVNADFTGSNLNSASLDYSDLTGANFTYAYLSGASLRSSTSTSAIFYGALLISADFTNADLSNANLADAALFDTIFNGAIVKGADISSTTTGGFTAGQLYTTRSYLLGDLTGIRLSGNNLSAWNFAAQNLTNADFAASTLTNANFVGVLATGANFGSTTITNANFSDADLGSARFALSVLTNSNFSGTNLFNARFTHSILTNDNFTDADLRGASGWSPDASTVTRNTIRPDGSIQGLALLAGEKLVIRDNPISVSVDTSASFDPASTLQLLLDENWTSSIAFGLGLTPSLGGALDLEFANGVDPSPLVGDTFQLFNWNGTLPAGDRFSMVTTKAGLDWDLSNLYSGGTVTLTAIPEPSTLLPASLGLTGATIFARRRKR
jgi:uncharacterized protein YjbI with pentapeptide repeats